MSKPYPLTVRVDSKGIALSVHGSPFKYLTSNDEKVLVQTIARNGKMFRRYEKD